MELVFVYTDRYIYGAIFTTLPRQRKIEASGGHELKLCHKNDTAIIMLRQMTNKLSEQLDTGYTAVFSLLLHQTEASKRSLQALCTGD